MCHMGSEPCLDGKECVLLSHICDGERDCMDGSDEQGCSETCKKGCFTLHFVSLIKSDKLRENAILFKQTSLNYSTFCQRKKWKGSTIDGLLNTLYYR